MHLTKFYKYATEFPWFMRLNMIVGYLAAWVGFVCSTIIAAIIPSIPGYKAVLLSAMLGGYLYVLLRMRKEMKIEPEVMGQMRIDNGVKDTLDKSLKKLL